VSCQVYEEMLSAYVDGELPPLDRQALEEHLATCDTCGQVLLELRSMKMALQSLPEVEPPAGLHATIMRNLKPRSQGLFAGLAGRLSGWTPRQWVPAVAAAMAFVLFLSVGGTYWYWSGRSSSGNLLSGMTKDQAAGQKTNLTTRGAQPGEPSSSAQFEGAATAPRAKSGGDAGSGGTAGSGVSGLAAGGAVLQDADRKIVRRAQVAAEVRRGGVKQAADEAIGIVKANFGYVESSSIVQSEQGQKEAASFYMVARVPEENLDKTIEGLAALGRTTRQDTSAQDITDQYVDLDARLRNKENEEQRLLQIMGQAKTVGELLQVEGELSRVRGDIESMKAQMQRYDKSVALSSLSLNITEEGATKRPPSSWHDVWQAFVNAWRALLLFVAKIAPTMIVLAAIAVAVALVLRKRRTA